MDTYFDSSHFKSRPDENLICGICLCVLNQPLQCRSGHNFCKHCVESLLQDGCKQCPMRCSEILHSCSDLVRNRGLAGIIENLEMYCPSLICGGGCTWTGTKSMWDAHKISCPFVSVCCEHKECSQVVLRKDLSQHMEECAYRQKSCIWCNKLFTETQLLLHCCEEEILPCPHSCETPRGSLRQCLRRDMDNHLLCDCPEQVIPCPMASLGCETSLPRKEMSHHQHTSMVKHQDILLIKVLQQNHQLAKQQELITETNSTSHTEVVFSISNFKRVQNYTSQTIEFMGRYLQVSFGSDVNSSSSFHSVIIHCACDIPTQIRSLTAHLYSQCDSDQSSLPVQASSTMTVAPAYTLLSERSAQNIYFAPISFNVNPTSGINDRYRLMRGRGSDPHATAFEFGNFIRTPDLVKRVQPETIITLSVKISICR